MNRIKILKAVKRTNETWNKLLKTYMSYTVKRLTRTMATTTTTEMTTVKVSVNCTRQVMSLTSLILMRLLSSASNSKSLRRTYLTSVMAPSHFKGIAKLIAPKLLLSNKLILLKAVKELHLDFASRSMTRGHTWMKQLDRGLETWSRLKEVQQTLSFKKKAKMFCQARRWECSLRRMPSNRKRTYRNRRTSISATKEERKMMTIQKSWKTWRNLNLTKKKCSGLERWSDNASRKPWKTENKSFKNHLMII